MLSFPRQILVSFTFVFLAPAAHADLTAQDVWSDWQAYIGGFGYTMDGQVDASDDGLIVSGVTLSTSLSGTASGAGSVNMTMDRIVFTEQGDGSVSIALPAIVPMEIAAKTDTGSDLRISLDFRHKGMDVLASGNPDALRYDYAADGITLTTTGVEIDGEVAPPQNYTAEVSLENLSGSTDMRLDALRHYDQSQTLESARYVLKFTDPDSNAAVDMSGQIQAMTAQGQTTLPLRPMENGNMDAMLAAGLTTTGVFGYDATAMTSQTDSLAGPSQVSIISGSGNFGVTMGQDGLRYIAGQKDLRVDITAAQFPLPLSFGIGSSAAELSMPLRRSSAAEDFTMLLSLEELTISETLWGMFDPTAQLPRDPASFSLHVNGKGRLMQDIFDPNQLAAMAPGAAPAQIEALNIRSLLVAAMGASLTGSGSFDFDNSAGGAPKPKGAVDLTLTGANALIDKLVATGLLPDQQAMGARMMMGLLGVPGDAPDTLNSRIEVNEEGHIMANGQRIR